MNILFFLAHPGVVGGADKVLIKYAEMLAGMGNNVLIVVPSAEGVDNTPLIKLCVDSALEYVECHYNCVVCIEDIDILDSYENFANVYDLVKLYKPDFIHYNQINITVEAVSNQCKIPHLESIYPVSKATFKINWINIFPRYLCTDSFFYAQRWSDGIGIESECIRVPYEKKPVNIEGKDQSDHRVLKILSVGNVDRYKRQLDIIMCLESKLIDGLSFQYTILGYCDSEYAQKCKQYVNTRGLQKYIHFEGYVENVEEYLARADLLIHASTTESYPGVIVEAMAYGVPVISTPVGGIPELVIDGENGFLAYGIGRECLFEVITRFLDAYSNGDTKYIVENAYCTFRENHAYSIVRNSLNDYYSKIMGYYDFSDAFCYDKLKKMTQKLLLKFGSSSVSEYTKAHFWYLLHLNEIFDKSNVENVYIWGAGLYGSKVIEWIRVLKRKILGFIDSNKSGQYFGYPIYKPSEEIINSGNVIIVAVVNPEALENICMSLESYGKERNVDFFLVHNNPCI